MAEFDTTEFLAHHGIKGQKWGVRNYQNPDGTLTSLGRKRYGIGNARKKTSNPVKNIIREAKKIRDDKKAEEVAAVKQKIKDHVRKNPKELQKYAKVLSKDEINEIIDDINFDKKLRAIHDDEVRAGWKKVSDFSSNVQTVGNLIGNGKNLYNNTADVYNTLVEFGVIKNGKRWPKVGEMQKEDRKAFNQLINSGSADDILKAFSSLQSSELNEYIRKEEARDKITRIKNGTYFNNKNDGNKQDQDQKTFNFDDVPPIAFDYARDKNWQGVQNVAPEFYDFLMRVNNS